MNRDHKQCLATIGWVKQQADFHKLVKQRSLDRRASYDTSPKRCKQCGTSIVYDRRENSFCCRACAAVFNNLKKGLSRVNGGVGAVRKAIMRGEGEALAHAKVCAGCGKPAAKKFCTSACASASKRKAVIEGWKSGKLSGCNVNGQIRPALRAYMKEKFNNKCARCGWNEENPFSHKIPLQVEHIDGNSTNNAEDNLTLLCPNCHSLTSTYMALNRGHGRTARRERYRLGKSS